MYSCNTAAGELTQWPTYTWVCLYICVVRYCIYTYIRVMLLICTVAGATKNHRAAVFIFVYAYTGPVPIPIFATLI